MAEREQAWMLSGGRSLSLDRPRVIAIINVTPDSFSDGGKYNRVDAAVARAHEAASEGAAMLDIGGESTRPGSAPVDDAEQIRRAEPVVRAIRAAGGVAAALPISVDTTRSAVARAALDAGADAVNDQSALRDDPAMAGLIAQRGCGVILMHRLRAPADDQYSTQYRAAPDYGAEGVVGAVEAFLRERSGAALAAGIGRGSIVLDPGLGFGKTPDQNFALIGAAEKFAALGFQVLCAASRKSFLGGNEPEGRALASVAVAVAQFLQSVRLFRVHDVKAHVQALEAASRLVGQGRQR